MTCPPLLLAAVPALGGLPLAAWDDLLQGAVPIIFMILYGIAQLLSNREQAQRKMPPPRPRPAVGPAPGQEPPAPATLEETLRREIDEFLRRSRESVAPPRAEPPAGRARAGDAASGSPAAPVRTQPNAAPSLARRSPAPAGPRTEPTAAGRGFPQPLGQRPPAGLPPAAGQRAAAGAAAESAAPRGERSTVAEHVAQHLGSGGSLPQRSAPLAGYVDQSDERMQQHVRERFEHQVGSLTRDASRPAAASAASSPRPTVAELRKLLAQPEGLRQAFIMSEILRRPDFFP